MQKVSNQPGRIEFQSHKNKKWTSVYTKKAQQYAYQLEDDDSVKSYKTNIALKDFTKKIDLIGIRTSYRNSEWTTDFMIVMLDGGVRVRELIEESDLGRRTAIEKIELSRRYWKVAGVDDWGLVLTDEVKANVLSE